MSQEVKPTGRGMATVKTVPLLESTPRAELQCRGCTFGKETSRQRTAGRGGGAERLQPCSRAALAVSQLSQKFMTAAKRVKRRAMRVAEVLHGRRLIAGEMGGAPLPASLLSSACTRTCVSCSQCPHAPCSPRPGAPCLPLAPARQQQCRRHSAPLRAALCRPACSGAAWLGGSCAAPWATAPAAVPSSSLAAARRTRTARTAATTAACPSMQVQMGWALGLGLVDSVLNRRAPGFVSAAAAGRWAPYYSTL